MSLDVFTHAEQPASANQFLHDYNKAEADKFSVKRR